jgi:hypothetical protein
VFYGHHPVYDGIKLGTVPDGELLCVDIDFVQPAALLLTNVVDVMEQNMVFLDRNMQ